MIVVSVYCLASRRWMRRWLKRERCHSVVRDDPAQEALRSSQHVATSRPAAFGLASDSVQHHTHLVPPALLRFKPHLFWRNGILFNSLPQLQLFVVLAIELPGTFN